MTTTFFEREPDTITVVGESHDLGYIFSYYEPGKGDQIGTYSVSVYSPRGYSGHWHAVKFYRADVAAYQVVSERDLTEREIALFEQRVKAYQQAGTA